MRKTFTYFLFLSIIVGVQAQTNTYYPLPSDSTYWRENATGFQSQYCSDYHYFISGDTIINGIQYHKISKSGVEYYQTPDGYCTNIISYYYYINYAGAYRNDSINKKVYGMYFSPFTQYPNDTLLYNFNLNLGDTLPPSALNNPNWGINVVTGIDSILIGSNYHKRFLISYANSSNSHVSLIEGIGSTYGLFGMLTPRGQHGTTLYCVLENGQIVYHYLDYPCDLITGYSNHALDNTQIEIFPNPLQDFATIKINPNLKLKFIIYNIYGIQILCYENIGNEFTFNTSKLNSGIYFYMFMDKNIITKIGKMIK